MGIKINGANFKVNDLPSSMSSIKNEITFRVVILTVILAVILSIANTYLALKIGTLASASIPAAILSMGIFRFFRQASILEHNLVQTGASAGEAVAGGIIFTIPAMVIVNYWHHFPYWNNFFIALLGSFSGILLSIPLRRFLLNDPSLRFPEGCAVAEVLKAGDSNQKGFKNLLLGGIFAAILEAFQNFKVFASSISYWKWLGKTIIGFSLGFSTILVGAGFLMGWDVALSLLSGSFLGWIVGIPFLSHWDYSKIIAFSAGDAVQNVLFDHVREIGISAMLLAGLFSLFHLVRPIYSSVQVFLSSFRCRGENIKDTKIMMDAREKDLPWFFMIGGLFTLMLAIGILISHFIPYDLPQLAVLHQIDALVLLVIYLLLFGFLISLISGYFSGLVGVSASPGSAIVIAGMLISALLIKFILSGTHAVSDSTLSVAGMGLSICLGSILAGIACIANDNMQDLKVGQIVGATPWRQQIMLLLGALVASAVIPAVVELLFQVYGIAGVVPHPGMSKLDTLPAPPAAVMALLTQGIFNGHMDWTYFGMGVFAIVLMSLIFLIFKRFNIRLSLLAMAAGIYLPMTTTSSLFIGGTLAQLTLEKRVNARQQGYLIACGVVVGAILMDVGIAGFAAYYGLEHLNLPYFLQSSDVQLSLGLASLCVLLLWWWRKMRLA